MANIWLRSEYKKYERRTPLVPAHAEILIALGHTVTVEESEFRVFPLEAYKKVGCKIVKAFEWKNAQQDIFILGLKELDDAEDPIIHKHIFFSHSFQNQLTACKLLSRFKQGNGMIYDLEYIYSYNKKRVATFGYHAGISAAALALSTYVSRIKK